MVSRPPAQRGGSLQDLRAEQPLLYILVEKLLVVFLARHAGEHVIFRQLVYDIDQASRQLGEFPLSGPQRSLNI